MKNEFRSNCPVSCALDLVGDKWTLVIMRDMLMFGKETFKDFSESGEGIATNILSSRLKMLEEKKVITKHKSKVNKRVNIYRLTEKGIALLPVIIELVQWSRNNVLEFQPKMNINGIDTLMDNKAHVIETMQASLRKKILSSL
ncbi:MAG: helix-turn-helix domain-containing protein [Saprospiraceae bacterium]|nr:helix-turn-helix domain-containing protein [Saprospiraceae bacterium]